MLSKCSIHSSFFLLQAVVRVFLISLRKADTTLSEQSGSRDKAKISSIEFSAADDFAGCCKSSGGKSSICDADMCGILLTLSIRLSSSSGVPGMNTFSSSPAVLGIERWTAGAASEATIGLNNWAYIKLLCSFEFAPFCLLLSKTGLGGFGKNNSS